MSGRLGGALFFAIVGTFVLALLAGLLFLSSSGDSSGSGGSSATRDSSGTEAAASAPIEGRPWLDQIYLRALGGQMMSESAEGEISMGRRACSALAEGRSSAEVRQVLEAKGLTPAQAGRVMLAAVKAYCPDYAKAVNP